MIIYLRCRTLHPNNKKYKIMHMTKQKLILSRSRETFIISKTDLFLAFQTVFSSSDECEASVVIDYSGKC